MDDKRKIKAKKREPLHAKDPLCWQENEEYYLNRYPRKAKTEGMYYYFQKVDGVTIKTEVTKEILGIFLGEIYKGLRGEE